MRRLLCPVLAAAALVPSGCGRSVSGDDWLFRLDGETVTVAEAGAYWDSLPPEVRQGFSSGGNPLGDFILAYSRKMLVEREAERLGLQSDPRVGFRVGAWTRLHAFRLAEDELRRQTAASLTPADDAYYLDHLGMTVWYSTWPQGGGGPSAHGPSVLSEMDPALGLLLAGLRPGDSAELADGSTVTLDSVLGTDPALVDAMRADSAGTLAYGRDRMAGQRALDIAAEMRAAYFSETCVEYRPGAFAGFARLVAGGADPASGDTLFTAGPEVWTAERMVEEIRLETETRPVMPSDTAWLSAFADVILYREALASRLGEIAPAAADSLAREAAGYGMRLAADSLYEMFVTDSIEITTGMLDSAYAAAPPGMPELRTFVCLSMKDSAAVDAFREALVSGRTSGIENGFDGIPGLSGQEGDPHLTRPLSAGEVPAGLGPSLFATTDTTVWFGPAPYAEMEIWVAFRLDSILPARQATLEEAVPALESSIRAAREQVRFEEWMRDLEQYYGLEMNEGVVNKLPHDPSLWSEL